MDSDVCPECKDKVNESTNRLIQDTCGHRKCRLCLMKEKSGCKICIENVIKQEEETKLNTKSTKKRKRSITLELDEKDLVINVYKNICENNPWNSAVELQKLTSEATGVDLSSVQNIITEDNYTRLEELKSNKKRKLLIESFGEFTRNTIRKKVHSFFLRNELPTMEKIVQAIEEDKDLPNLKRATLYGLLKAVNFKFEKGKIKSVLLDKNNIILWRRNYLRSIKKFRENRKIYYLDETWVNENHSVEKVCVVQNIKSSTEAILEAYSSGLKQPSSKGRSLVIIHIGSEDGFVENGLLTFESKNPEDISTDIFENWFKKIVEKLEENSVIVMDNASYHNRKLEPLPTISWRKVDIQTWLLSKNMGFDDDMLKIELLHIVKGIKKDFQISVLEKLAEQKNIEILKIPPYHNELNPIELIWAQIKGEVARNNISFKMEDVKKLFNTAIKNITQQNWYNAIQHTLKVERHMWDLDDIIEELIEPLLKKNDENVMNLMKNDDM